MKRYLILLLSILFVVELYAQDIVFTKETFDDNNNIFGLEEFKSRNSSGVISDGCYIYTKKKWDIFHSIKLKIPVSEYGNFMVEFRFILPKFNKETTLSISTGNFVAQCRENRFFPNIGVVDGLVASSDIEYFPKGLPILLPKGKDKEINIKIERKGRTTYLYVNDMEVYMTKNVIYGGSDFEIGFPFGVLKIDEIIVQRAMED